MENFIVAVLALIVAMYQAYLTRAAMPAFKKVRAAK